MMSTSDRHRLMLATAVTVVALPTLWIASRNDATAVPRVAAVGAPAPGADAPTASDRPADTLDDSLDDTLDDSSADTPAAASAAASAGLPAAPAYLEGPGSPRDPGAPAEIASPDPSDGLVGTAGYERFGPGMPSRACRVDAAPWGALVTVRNLDTDRTTTCLNTPTSPAGGSDVVTIHMPVFLEIAELVDAPLPVELSW